MPLAICKVLMRKGETLGECNPTFLTTAFASCSWQCAKSTMMMETQLRGIPVDKSTIHVLTIHTSHCCWHPQQPYVSHFVTRNPCELM